MPPVRECQGRLLPPFFVYVMYDLQGRQREEFEVAIREVPMAVL